jgi:hypothetical protein
MPATSGAAKAVKDRGAGAWETGFGRRHGGVARLALGVRRWSPDAGDPRRHGASGRAWRPFPAATPIAVGRLQIVQRQDERG